MKKKHAIHLDLRHSKKSFFQKGYRGSFIYDDCEKETAKLDSYASHIFKNKIFCLSGVQNGLRPQKLDRFV